MTRWLETDTYTNKDISAAVSIGVYTADADRLVLCQFFADQVAGNGDYEFYLTQQIGGSGSSYRHVPKTTATVASGVTAIAGQSIHVAVRSGDVLTLYLDGLAGDTATPDTTVRWFEMAALRPATADRTIAVDASGLVDLVDAPNATAVAAIQNGLATYDNVASVLSSVNAQTAIFVGMIQAITGARGNFAAVASAGTISSGSEQSGTYASTKALDSASVWRVGGSTLIDFYLTFTVPAGSVMRAIVVRAECNNSQVPAFYVSNNASDWTSLGQQSEAVPDQYEIDTFILTPSNAVTAGEDGLVYVRVYASYYGPLTLDVSYIAVVMETAAGGGLTAQETADAVNNLVAAGATASVGEKLDDILEDTGTTLPGLFAASGAIVTVVSPVASAGSATVYQGDDYAAGDGRALEWSGTTWADLTAALSVTLYVRAPDGSLFSVEGSVVSAGGVTQTVRFELTDDDTAMLVAWPSSSELRIRAVLASGGKATLVDTTLLVIEDVA